MIHAIFENEVDGELGKDYALVRLKKKASGRVIQPLTTKLPKRGQMVSILGHPSGLPMKYAGFGLVTKDKNRDYFQAAIDSSGGNSEVLFTIKGERLTGFW